MPLQHSMTSSPEAQTMIWPTLPPKPEAFRLIRAKSSRVPQIESPKQRTAIPTRSDRADTSCSAQGFMFGNKAEVHCLNTQDLHIFVNGYSPHHVTFTRVIFREQCLSVLGMNSVLHYSIYQMQNDTTKGIVSVSERKGRSLTSFLVGFYLFIFFSGVFGFS
jgi:hypothetical protein